MTDAGTTTARFQQSPISKRVVERMREGRHARRWSAAELAERMAAAGMPWKRNTVADLENGFRKDVTADELVALAFVFNVAVTAFVDGATGIESMSVEDRLDRLEAALFRGDRA